MTELPVSTRISRDTKRLIEDIVASEQVDKSTAVRKLLLIGAGEYRLRRALEALGRGEASFSKAAEMARLTVWEFADHVKARRVHWVADDVDEDVRRGLAG
jgi:predicted HTH domain antitoxin